MLSIGLGMLVTRVLEPAWGIGTVNERVNAWFAAHRRWELTGEDIYLVVCEFGFVGGLVFGYFPPLSTARPACW